MRKALMLTVIEGIVFTLLMTSVSFAAEVTKNIRWSIVDRSADTQHYQVYKSSVADWQVMEAFGEPILITGPEYVDATEITHPVTFEVPDGEDHVVFFSVRAIDTSGNLSNYAVDNDGNTMFIGFRFMNEPPSPPSGIGAQ